MERLKAIISIYRSTAYFLRKFSVILTHMKCLPVSTFPSHVLCNPTLTLMKLNTVILWYHVFIILPTCFSFTVLWNERLCSHKISNKDYGSIYVLLYDTRPQLILTVFDWLFCDQHSCELNPNFMLNCSFLSSFCILHLRLANCLKISSVSLVYDCWIHE